VARASPPPQPLKPLDANAASDPSKAAFKPQSFGNREDPPLSGPFGKECVRCVCRGVLLFRSAAAGVGDRIL